MNATAGEIRRPLSSRKWLPLLSFGVFIVSAMAGAVNWPFQFFAVGVVHLAAGAWSAKSSHGPLLALFVLCSPWPLIAGSLVLSDWLVHVFPIVAIAPLSAAAGYLLIASTRLPRHHLHRWLISYSTVLALLAGFGMPNWLALARSIPDQQPLYAHEYAFSFRGPDEFKSERTVPDAYAGQVLVLDLWTITCAQCFARFPELEAFSNEFEDSDSVAVVAVNLTTVGETPGQAKAMLDRLNYSFDAVYADLSIDEAQRRFGFRGVPAAVVFDRSGAVRYVGTPELHPTVFVNNLRRIVRNLVDESRTPPSATRPRPRA